jgi:hypothetical protein
VRWAAASGRSLPGRLGRSGGGRAVYRPSVRGHDTAERATWDAEQARVSGASDPEAWCAAAEAWQDLGCLHRAGYAWWRHAQAQLDVGQPTAAAAAALRGAAAAAEVHAPLLAQVRLLAERAGLLPAERP